MIWHSHCIDGDVLNWKTFAEIATFLQWVFVLACKSASEDVKRAYNEDQEDLRKVAYDWATNHVNGLLKLFLVSKNKKTTDFLQIDADQEIVLCLKEMANDRINPEMANDRINPEVVLYAERALKHLALHNPEYEVHKRRKLGGDDTTRVLTYNCEKGDFERIEMMIKDDDSYSSILRLCHAFNALLEREYGWDVAHSDPNYYHDRCRQLHKCGDKLLNHVRIKGARFSILVYFFCGMAKYRKKFPMNVRDKLVHLCLTKE